MLRSASSSAGRHSRQGGGGGGVSGLLIHAIGELELQQNDQVRGDAAGKLATKKMSISFAWRI